MGTYFKLNEYDYTNGHFPLDAAGYFCDGWNVSPILRPLQQTVLMETTEPIVESDAALLQLLKLKRIPADVVYER